MSARSIRRAHQREVERDERRSGRLGKRAAAGAAAGTLGAVAFAAPAEAATFTVSNLNDAGAGSLREAIEDANLTGASDTVVFQSGLSGTITLASEITIDEPVEIQGPGADTITVSGDDQFQIFDADTGDEPVAISGLTLTEGLDGGDGGGAVRTDDVELTLTDMVFTGNEADERGGALYADQGTIEITNTTFSDNVAADDGGAVGVSDTNDVEAVEVFIRDSVFTGNQSDEQGGALYLHSLDSGVLVENSTFTDNTADDDGGGIYVNAAEELGDVTIDSVTVAGNSSGDMGGGIWIPDEGDPSLNLIQSSTISGNTADGAGGGIAVATGEPDADDTTIRNSTIADNTAGSRGGGVYRDGYESDPGVFVGDRVAVSSTILAGNTATSGADLAQNPGLDSDEGEFVLGFSLVGSTGNATVTESPAGSNLIGVDPLLGPLADNGGPTETHLPALTSPAMDAGIANGLSQDQRGLARTFDATNLANAVGGDATDIGAVEQAAEGVCKGLAATVLFAPGQPITGSSGPDVIVGTTGKDKVNSGGGKDAVCVGEGKDKVSAKGGKDTVKGGPGKDKLKGGAGKDKLSGQGGKDTLKGQGGKDTLKGGPGKDKLRGGPGKDKLNGGGGKDTEIQ